MLQPTKILNKLKKKQKQKLYKGKLILSSPRIIFSIQQMLITFVLAQLNTSKQNVYQQDLCAKI